MSKPKALGRGLDALITIDPYATAHGFRPGMDGDSEITITVSPQVRKAIEEMHGCGLFGITIVDVVEEMVRAGAREGIRKGWARPPRGLVVRDGELMLEDVTTKRRVTARRRRK